MGEAHTLTGTLTDDRTVALDEAVNVGSARVRIVIQPLTAPAKPLPEDVLGEIWAAQDAQGYVPREREQVDAGLTAEKASWGDQACGSTWMPPRWSSWWSEPLCSFRSRGRACRIPLRF